MQQEEQTIRSILSMNVAMNALTSEQQAKHDAATICISCNQQFTEGRRKARHQCHVTGKYIAHASVICVIYS